MVFLSIRTRESREKVCLLMTRWIVRMEKAGFFEINAAYSKVYSHTVPTKIDCSIIYNVNLH